jgi:hypothetical protein
VGEVCVEAGEELLEFGDGGGGADVVDVGGGVDVGFLGCFLEGVVEGEAEESWGQRAALGDALFHGHGLVVVLDDGAGGVVCRVDGLEEGEELLEEAVVACWKMVARLTLEKALAMSDLDGAVVGVGVLQGALHVDGGFSAGFLADAELEWSGGGADDAVEGLGEDAAYQTVNDPWHADPDTAGGLAEGKSLPSSPHAGRRALAWALRSSMRVRWAVGSLAMRLMSSHVMPSGPAALVGSGVIALMMSLMSMVP